MKLYLQVDLLRQLDLCLKLKIYFVVFKDLSKELKLKQPPIISGLKNISQYQPYCVYAGIKLRSSLLPPQVSSWRQWSA
jgi:hypothetical protein